uniref:Vacuolar protein-sorting-associated protein 36 n=1 Tax=Bursaphelenchus xylophilus TaxID=6326 RepID=A0A1I7STM1_BURXY
MDRLSWYTPGESMEEILIQAGHVGIYDGDMKQSSFEQGTASLTLQRVIWADSTDPDCRLVLHHSLVDKIERHHKSMFGRGGKIIVTLKPAGAGHSPGPVASSGFNSLRFVFRQGGEEEFYKKYMDALTRQTWKRTSSSSSSGGSRNCTLYANPGGGPPSQRSLVSQAVSEKKFTEQNNRLNQTISQDMSRLMEEAREMVNLSKSITERLRMSKEDMTEEETISFKNNLLLLGVSDPVMKSAFGHTASYYDNLAKKVNDILLESVENNGQISLPEAYCKVNRSLVSELFSPEDLLNACQRFDDIASELSLESLPDGSFRVRLREGLSSSLNASGQITSDSSSPTSS